MMETAFCVSGQHFVTIKFGKTRASILQALKFSRTANSTIASGAATR